MVRTAAPSAVSLAPPTPSELGSARQEGKPLSGRLLFSADHDSACIARGTVVYQWGGGPPGYDPRPAISVDADVVSVSCTSDHSCLVTAKGELWCYGLNQFGQLGFETTTRCGYEGVYPCAILPNRVPGLPPMSTVATSNGQTCGLTREGSVYCWGFQTVGWRGKDVAGTTMTLVPNLHNAKKLVVGHSFGCAIDGAGRVSCWGQNAYGELGRGKTSDFELEPKPIAGLRPVEDVSAGSGHVCVLSSGQVYCWGLNEDRQVGPDGERCGPVICQPRPHSVSLSQGATASSISLSSTGSCALDRDGALYCWGQGRDETFGKRRAPCTLGRCAGPPQRVEGLPQLQAMTYGETHLCGLSTEGTFLCWGALENIKFSSAKSVQSKPRTPECASCVGPIFTADPDVLLKPSVPQLTPSSSTP